MKKMFTLIFVAFSAVLFIQSQTSQAQIIAGWTFETTSNSITGSSTTIGPITADLGSGTASGMHASSATWSHPSGNGSPSCFSVNTWSVGDYFEFDFSTLGQTGVQLSFDQASSNTGPGTFGLFYSLNGGAFTQLGSDYTVMPNASPNPTWNPSTYNNIYTFTPSLGGLFDNASSVAVRLVDMSTVSANGGTVATAGTDRVDNFIVFVPEPGFLALTVLGGLLALLCFRRRRFAASHPG